MSTADSPQSADTAAGPPRHKHWLWPTRRRVILGLVVALAIWGWLDVRRRGESDPERWWEQKTDLTVYTEAGAAFFDQRDPYEVTNLRGWKYLYLPLFAIVLAPLHHLDAHDQVMVWFALSVLMGWGCYHELVRIARRVLPEGTPQGQFGPIPDWLGYTAVAAVTLPALNCLQRGQVGLAKLYLLLLGFRLLIEGRSWWRGLAGGFAFALAITLKITPIVPAAIALGQAGVAAWNAHLKTLWVRVSAGSLGTVAGLAAAILIVPGLLIGWQTNLDHLDTWWNKIAMRAEKTTEVKFAGDSTSVRNQSLSNAVHRLGNWAHYVLADGPNDAGSQHATKDGPVWAMDAPVVDRALLVPRFLAACLAVLVGFRMGRSQDALGQAAAFGLACIATLVIFPIARGHYYVLLLPGVVFVSLWILRDGRRRLALTMAIIPAALVIAHYVALKQAGRIGLLGLGTTGWYAIAGCLLLWPQKSAAAGAGSTPDETAPDASTDQRPLAA